MEFQIGDTVSHFRFGKGIILGNYHKRADGHYYWHIKYFSGTFGYNRESSLALIKSAEEKPYVRGKYNPKYGDNKICECGHTYDRHFDSYEDNYPCGCKYCRCYKFKEKKEGI